MEAAKGSWYPAYSAYSQIDDLVSSVNEILKRDSPFVRSGYGVKLKIFKSIAHSYSPLEAAYSAESIFSTYNEHAQKNAMVKECTKFLAQIHWCVRYPSRFPPLLTHVGFILTLFLTDFK